MNKLYEHKIKHYQIVNQNGGNPRKLKPLHRDKEERVLEDDNDDMVKDRAEIEDDKYRDVNYYIDTAIELENNFDNQANFYYSEAYSNYPDLILEVLKNKDLKNSKELFGFTKNFLLDNINSSSEEITLRIKTLKLLYKKGNIDAGMYLAKMYKTGYLLKKNICKALEIYQKINLLIDTINFDTNSKYTNFYKGYKKIYNIKNNIIYTYREKIIKKYIIKCLTGYYYEKKKLKYNVGDEWVPTIKSNNIKIEPLKISEINNFFSYINDYDIMYNSVIRDGCLLEYASKNIKNETKIIEAAVLQNGLALKYASDNLKKNNEIILKAVSNNGMILEYILTDVQIPKKFINEKNTIISAVRSNGLALQFASYELKDDIEIVQEAVKQNGLALQYTTYRLKDNKIIVNIAIKQNGLALQYVSDRLKSRIKIIIKAVNQNGLALQYVPNDLKSRTIDITGVAIRNNISAINYSTIKLNDLPRISFLIYNYNYELIKFADDEIKNNYDVILNCVKKDGLLLEFASEKLKENKDIILAAIKQNLLAHKFTKKEFLLNNEIIFYLFFKQRNLIFLINDYSHHPTFNIVDESYPLRLDNEYSDNFFSSLYSILLDIKIKNIPKELVIKIKNDLEIYPPFDDAAPQFKRAILAGPWFKRAILDRHFIKSYFTLMMKCCLNVSNYYEDSINKNEAIFNVKNFPILVSNRENNQFYRYIGLIKELKDTVLSKSGLLKLLLKKICLIIKNEKKSRKILNLIIKSAISKNTLIRNLKIITDSNYYNPILHNSHNEEYD